MFYPVFFIVPSFIFSIFGYDKSEVFSFNEPKIYDDKGGSFIFTEAYHSLGNIGVICHGVLLGFLIAYFYSSAKASRNMIFHFPLVSLILVASRKDIIYGIKYISLEFILMFVFYLFIFFFLRKQQGSKMKVMIINTLYYPYKVGGAEVSVRLLAEGLVNLGDQVTVLSLNNKGSKEDAIYSGVLNSSYQFLMFIGHMIKYINPD